MAKLSAATEQNESGCLVYATEYMGAFARGKTMEEALEKLPADVVSYCRFANRSTPKEPFELCVVQQKQSALQVCDADSDILLDCEIPPLTILEYLLSKELCLKSAECFLRLYEAIPSPDALLRPRRKTFYGEIPATAHEMYTHTNGVTSYYAGEIGAQTENSTNIFLSRLAAFAAIEATPDYLLNHVFIGSHDEAWTLRKVLRRFLWHDRIHAKALYQRACTLWGRPRIPNEFYFPE